MMMSSRRRQMYSKRRRRSKNKKPLYTQFRCEPDPWEGSPPQTPPSSDDEADVGNDIRQQSNGGRVHDVWDHSSSADANDAHDFDRLQHVKRKLSQYIKMENANVLQSHQFTQRQTIKTARKTAPVPLPFNLNSNKKKLSANKKKIKNRAKSLKQKKSVRQTAPAPKPPQMRVQQQVAMAPPPPPHPLQLLAVENQEMRSISISTETEEKLPMFDDSANAYDDLPEFVSSNDELIDFASIPEAYYVGFDQSIVMHNTPPTIVSLSSCEELLSYSTAQTSSCVEEDDDEDEGPRLSLSVSGSGSSTPNGTTHHITFEEIFDDDANDNEAHHRHDLDLDQDEAEVEEVEQVVGDESDSYFGDDKFEVLADEILNDNDNDNAEPIQILSHSAHAQHVHAQHAHHHRMQQQPLPYANHSLTHAPPLPPHAQQQMQYEFRPAHAGAPPPPPQNFNYNFYSSNQSANIWAEPSSTLGCMLMKGLPPISTHFENLNIQ